MYKLYFTHELYFSFLLKSIPITISLSVYYLSRERQNKRILEWKKIWKLSLALATSLIKHFLLLRTFLPPQTHLVNSHVSLRRQPACHFFRNHPWSSNLKQVLLIHSQCLYFSFISVITYCSCSLFHACVPPDTISTLRTRTRFILFITIYNALISGIYTWIYT